MFGKKEKTESLKEIGERLKAAGTDTAAAKTPSDVKNARGKKQSKPRKRKLSGLGLGIMKTDSIHAVTVQKNKAKPLTLPTRRSPKGKSGMMVLPVGDIYHEFKHMSLGQFQNTSPSTLRSNFSRNFAKQSGSREKWHADYRFLGVETLQGRKNARLVTMGASEKTLEAGFEEAKNKGLFVSDFQSVMAALLPIAESLAPPTGQTAVLLPMNKDDGAAYQTAVYFFNEGRFWFGRVTSSGDLADKDEALKFIIRIKQTKSGLSANIPITWIMVSADDHVFNALSEGMKRASDMSGEENVPDEVEYVPPPYPLNELHPSEWPAAGGAVVNMGGRGVQYFDPVAGEDYCPRLTMVNLEKRKTRSFQFRMEVLLLFLVLTICGFFGALKFQEMYLLEQKISRMSRQTQISRLEKKRDAETEKLDALKRRLSVPIDFEKDADIPWMEVLNYFAAAMPEEIYFEKLSLKRNPAGDGSTWLMACEGFVADGLTTKEVRFAVDSLKNELDGLTEKGLFLKLMSFKERRGDDVLKISSADTTPAGVYTGLEFTVSVNPNIVFK